MIFKDTRRYRHKFDIYDENLTDLPLTTSAFCEKPSDLLKPAAMNTIKALFTDFLIEKDITIEQLMINPNYQSELIGHDDVQTGTRIDNAIYRVAIGQVRMMRDAKFIKFLRFLRFRNNATLPDDDFIKKYSHKINERVEEIRKIVSSFFENCRTQYHEMSETIQRGISDETLSEIAHIYGNIILSIQNRIIEEIENLERVNNKGLMKIESRITELKQERNITTMKFQMFLEVTDQLRSKISSIPERSNLELEFYSAIYESAHID